MQIIVSGSDVEEFYPSHRFGLKRSGGVHLRPVAFLSIEIAFQKKLLPKKVNMLIVHFVPFNIKIGNMIIFLLKIGVDN